jgi:hypothetical protein
MLSLNSRAAMSFILKGHSLKYLSSFTLHTLLAKYVKEMFSNSTINITKH